MLNNQNPKPTTAKLQDFVKYQQGEDNMTDLNHTYRCRFTNNGRQLRITVPEILKDKSFEVFYADGKILFSVTKNGVRSYVNGSLKSPTYYVSFSARKWVPGMPVVSFVSNVTMKNGSFDIDIPPNAPPPDRRRSPQQNYINEYKRPEGIEQSPPVVTLRSDVDIKRTPTTPREKAKACIDYLNGFAEKNDFTFDIVGGKLTLLKADRIG